MTEREALMRSVCESPDDDAPRLVFADWLDENGEADRAEFIRAQIAISSLPAGDRKRAKLVKREGELIQRHGAEWIRHLTPAVTPVPHPHDLWYEWNFWQRTRSNAPGRVAFARGFVAELRLGPVEFEELPPDTFAADPIQSLTFDSDGYSDYLEEPFFTHPMLPQLRQLGLHVPAIDPELVGTILGLPALAKLRSFVVAACQAHPGWLERLGADSSIESVRLINVRTIGVTTDEMARWMAAVPALPRLRDAVFFGDWLTTEVLSAMLDAGLGRSLRSLTLQYSQLQGCSDRDIARLISLPSLVRLQITYAGVDPRSLADGFALARSGSLREIVMDASEAPLTPEMFRTIIASPLVADLTQLEIFAPPIDDALANFLAASANLRGIQKLRLLARPKPEVAIRDRLRKHFGRGVVLFE